MPRKKSPKRSPQRQVKKRETTKAGVLPLARKTEQQLLKMPEKLTKLLSKEISAQKKRESKLQKLSAKQKKLVKKTEQRMAAVLNGKTTPTTQRKLGKAKKTLKTADKAFNDVQQQLQVITENLTKLVDEHAKFASLSKYLDQFNPNWDKSSKVEKAKSKAVKAKRKLKSVTPEQPAAQAEETAFDQLGFDEVTELAS